MARLQTGGGSLLGYGSRQRPAVVEYSRSAIITRHLGFTIDISCGGIDNLFRHHDYNIAVIESVSGEEFAKYWVHCEHLLVGGKKMSKSVGNIVYLEDLLRDGYDSRQIRFYLLYGQHRQRINLTDGILRAAAARLDAFRGMVRKILGTSPGDEAASSSREASEGAGSLIPIFEKGLDDDLDVKTAFDGLFEAVERLEGWKARGRLGREDINRIEGDLHRIDGVLQVIFS